MTARLDQMLAMNADFKEAYIKGERWALQHAEAIRGIDGQASRRFPERAFKEDGHTRRNWCGTCAHKEGCISCDLPGDHASMKGMIGIYDD
jgi:hypothetical protein